MQNTSKNPKGLHKTESTFTKPNISRKRKTPPKKTKSTSRKPKTLPQNLKHFQKIGPQCVRVATGM